MRNSDEELMTVLHLIGVIIITLQDICNVRAVYTNDVLSRLLVKLQLLEHDDFRDILHIYVPHTLLHTVRYTYLHQLTPQYLPSLIYTTLTYYHLDTLICIALPTHLKYTLTPFDQVLHLRTVSPTHTDTHTSTQLARLHSLLKAATLYLYALATPPTRHTHLHPPPSCHTHLPPTSSGHWMPLHLPTGSHGPAPAIG